MSHFASYKAFSGSAQICLQGASFAMADGVRLL
jgi:hypothetical protein